MDAPDNRPRCTLAQLRARWGKVRAPASPQAGDAVLKETMDGGEERWHVVSASSDRVDLVRDEAPEAVQAPATPAD